MNKKLFDMAFAAASNAYVPYSHFRVGAAVLFESSRIYTGCNVENSSFGLTLCAERNAISTAIAAGEKGNIKAIAISSPNSKMCYPCGACLQWMSEFCSHDMEIILENENCEPVTFKLSEFLPYQFRKDRLI